MGEPTVAFNLVAVTPNDPAVPVVADRVTVLTPRINLPALAEGINVFSATMNEAGRVAANERPVRLPVVPSLYVTFTVAVTAIAIPGLYSNATQGADPSGVCLFFGSSKVTLDGTGFYGQLSDGTNFSFSGGDLVVNGISLTKHVHTGVMPGGGTTGTPQ